MNKSYKLLLSCIKLFLSKDAFYLNDISNNTLDIKNWDDFLKTTEFHRLTIIIASILLKYESNNIPKKITDHIGKISKQKQFHQLHLSGELFRILNSLNHHNIQPIPLK